MSTVLALISGSAIVGFLIGLRYHWIGIALIAPIIAVTSAITLRSFHFVQAVEITFVSLFVNQIAYLIGAWVKSITEQSDDHIGDDC